MKQRPVPFWSSSSCRLCFCRCYCCRSAWHGIPGLAGVHGASAPDAKPDAGIEVSAPRAPPPLNPSWHALPGSLPGASHSAPQGNAIPGSEDTRKATAVLTHFRNRMFKGDLLQSIDLTIRDYTTCAEQLELDERQKVTYFVNVLEDSPRNFLLFLLQEGHGLRDYLCSHAPGVLQRQSPASYTECPGDAEADEF